MRKVVALVAVFGLGGCQSFNAEVTKITDWLASPNTTQAFSNLQKGAQALVCAIANASAVAGQIEAAVNAGQAVIGTNGKVYVASAIICGSLGGTVTGSATVK